MTDYQRVLDQIAQQARREFGKGRVAGYIPALAKAPPRAFGMAIELVGGGRFTVGDAARPFSIQSISKLFTLALALDSEGARLWKRVGREPSGNPFNSLVQLEYERGIPRNPFINAGALVVTDCIVASERDPKRAILDEVRRLSGNRSVAYDEAVARSEREHGHRNAAMAHFLKSHGNLRCAVDDVLDAYFHQCAIAMSCADLARAAGHLASGGVSPATGERIMPARRVKRINALMLTCGLYDAVGNFAYRVGIPAKSGVGGGIVGVIPGLLSTAVWSPELDAGGNSCAGTKALELLTTKLKRSVF